MKKISRRVTQRIRELLPATMCRLHCSYASMRFFLSEMQVNDFAHTIRRGQRVTKIATSISPYTVQLLHSRCVAAVYNRLWARAAYKKKKRRI